MARAVGPPGSAAVAAGSQATADAAAEVLRAGGNAVDAVIAAGLAATVAEPGLTSLAGGGFLLSRSPAGDLTLVDFFVQTPGLDRDPALPVSDFVPVTVKFAGEDQVFHAGGGAVAVPGVLAGYLTAHRALGRLPLAQVVAPARRLAERGAVIEPAQAEVLFLIGGVLRVTPPSRALYERDGRSLAAGDRFADPDLADFLRLIADEEVTGLTSPAFADPLMAAMAEYGGMVTRADLAAYTVHRREPLITEHAGAFVVTNPMPSFGGPIVIDALAALRSRGRVAGWGDVAAALVAATEQRRLADSESAGVATQVSRGTTHVSVVDADGGTAAMTTSNGSCSGVVVPGTGIQLNNMLGEDDLNPGGQHSLAPGLRMGSMMAPTVVVRPDGSVVALGSGGSKRIRSALLAVTVRLLDRGESLADAVAAPRVHPSDGSIQVEPGHTPEALASLGAVAPVHEWQAPNLYFGGVHAVARSADGAVEAVADPRRGGAVALVRPA